MLKFRLVSLMCALTLLSIPATSTAQTIAAVDVAPAAELEPVQQPQPQPQPQPQAQPASPRPTVAAEYSDAYVKRRKIHLYASFATAPLFVAQYIVGQKLYDDGGSDGQRGAHSALGVGIGALFGVNTVTGVWNLWESRKESKRSYEAGRAQHPDAGLGCRLRGHTSIHIRRLSRHQGGSVL